MDLSEREPLIDQGTLCIYMNHTVFLSVPPTVEEAHISQVLRD